MARPGTIQKGEVRNPGGRPKKSPAWKKAEDAMRAAIPRILMMKKDALAKLLSNNPTVLEVMAAAYIKDHPTEAINRFLGKVPDVVDAELTGKMVITFDPGTD